MIIRAADAAHFSAALQGILPEAAFHLAVLHIVGIAEIFRAVTPGTNLDHGSEQFRRHGIEVRTGIEIISIVGNGNDILPGKKICQFLGRDLSVHLTPDQFPIVIVKVNDQIVIPGIGIPLIGQNGGKLTGFIVFPDLFLDDFPVSVPKLRLSDTTMVVIRNSGKVQLGVVPNVPEILVHRGSAIGHTGMTVHLSKIDMIGTIRWIVPLFQGKNFLFHLLGIIRYAAVHRFRKSSAAIGGIHSFCKLPLFVDHKNTSMEGCFSSNQ